MVHAMNYNVVADVINSWEILKKKRNFAEVAGIKLFERLFTLNPEAKVFFKVDKSIPTDELLKSPRFVKHASILIRMIDNTLELLGPDIELLTEIMIDLGDKHAKLGVSAKYFPLMRDALIYVLEDMLGPDVFTDSVQESWTTVFDAFSDDMTTGYVMSEQVHCE